MTPGPVEEAGRVATSVVDGLKAQPISLALIVLNIVFLAVGYLVLSKISDRSAAEAIRADELIGKLAQCYQTPK